MPHVAQRAKVARNKGASVKSHITVREFNNSVSVQDGFRRSQKKLYSIGEINSKVEVDVSI